MDNFEAFNRPNSYPAYTLAELKGFVANGEGNALMVAEISHREGKA